MLLGKSRLQWKSYLPLAFQSTNSGERTSKATKWQRLLLQEEFALDVGEARYGRKLDLQCRCGIFELNNSEFKSAEASSCQIDTQYRKNLRVNQAMALYLHDQIGMPLEGFSLLALDVHGKCKNTFLLLLRSVAS